MERLEGHTIAHAVQTLYKKSKVLARFPSVFEPGLNVGSRHIQCLSRAFLFIFSLEVTSKFENVFLLGVPVASFYLGSYESWKNGSNDSELGWFEECKIQGNPISSILKLKGEWRVGSSISSLI